MSTLTYRDSVLFARKILLKNPAFYDGGRFRVGDFAALTEKTCGDIVGEYTQIPGATAVHGRVQHYNIAERERHEISVSYDVNRCHKRFLTTKELVHCWRVVPSLDILKIINESMGAWDITRLCLKISELSYADGSDEITVEMWALLTAIELTVPFNMRGRDVPGDTAISKIANDLLVPAWLIEYFYRSNLHALSSMVHGRVSQQDILAFSLRG